MTGTNTSDVIGIGIIGFGVVGRTHAAAYAEAARAGFGCRVVAIHSRSLGRAGADTSANLAELGGDTGLDPDVRIAASVDELLNDPRVRLVSICTHTDTHVELALRALDAGKHVLVEKPVALSADAIRPLTEAAARAGTLCMPARCMRFWPGWDWLRDRILAGDFGEVRAAMFERTGLPPTWGRHFYEDFSKSGGGLHDLHVHDVDFIRWCFGHPAAVSSVGSLRRVVTQYRYPAGPRIVTADGGWVAVPGAPFRMRYRVEFEDAIADFRHDREHPLLLTRNGETEPVPLPDRSAYAGQAMHLLSAIREGRRDILATVAEAEAVARILEAERRSAETGDVVAL